MEFKKGLHYSPEIEQAILGVCLIEKDGFGRIYGLVEEETFYSTSHRLVFASMRSMYEQGMMIDSYTVADFIMRHNGLEQIENIDILFFICRLNTYVVSGAHHEYHCHIIKMMWMEREIITLTHSGIREGSISEQIKAIQDKIYQLQQKSTRHDWTDMTQLLVDLYRHQEEMKKTQGVGIRTGLSTIDRDNGGFQNGQLVIIGARPSMGKSALIGGMAIDMAKTGLVIGIISLEMSNNEIAARLTAYDTNTDFNVVYRGLYRDKADAENLYAKVGNSTSKLPIYVSDKTKVSIPEIRAKAEKLKALHGLSCLFIDYLQLVSAIGGSYSKNRENEIAEMSRGCKIMAKEMNIPVVLLCQLNREVTRRKGHDRYPQLSDLRESGAIEQDADIVMFLHRDFMAGFETNENGESTETQADLVVRKWRNGKSNFIIPMDFDPPKMKFSERKKFFQMPLRPTSEVEKEEDPF